MESERFIKVNLILEGGCNHNGEGVWAECLTEKDLSIYLDESKKGEKFMVKILNHPITTTDVKYGYKVNVVNMGEYRPVLATPARPLSMQAQGINDG